MGGKIVPPHGFDSRLKKNGFSEILLLRVNKRGEEGKSSQRARDSFFGRLSRIIAVIISLSLGKIILVNGAYFDSSVDFSP